MFLLMAGVRESARANTVLVLTKLLILVFFIVVGVTHFTGSHFSTTSRRTAPAAPSTPPR